MLGVIPDNHDPDLLIDEPRKDFGEYIRNLQNEGYKIAMHGYQHVFDVNANGIVTRKCAYNHSEFAGHPYNVQYQKIREGKAILESHGIHTDVFFAPAHAYDDNTLRALAANGFKYISDGKSNKPYVRHGIICVPARSSGIDKMRFGIYHTAVIHAHEWVFEEKEIAWNQLVSLFKDSNNDIIPFNDYIHQSLGNTTIQMIFEKQYCLWERYLREYIRIIWRKIK